MIIKPGSSEPPQPGAGMKFCPVCEKEIARGARTCPQCGKTFTTFGGMFIAIILGLLLGGYFLLRR